MINYSIVISTYNQVNTLRLTLESLRRQIKNPKTFEIVIADDCSSDGTEGFVKKLRYPIFLKYSRSENVEGRARNRNRGFQKAAGRWIIFLDGDMVPQAGFIDSYLRSWDEYPDAVVIGSWIYPEEWEISRWQKYFATRGRLVMAHGDSVPGKYFTSDNFAIKKTLLEHFCGFDSSFESWGGEDTDFGLRLERDSIPICYIPEARCCHYQTRTFSQTLSAYEKYGQGGFPLLADRYGDAVIFERGWILGLHGLENRMSLKVIAALLRPLRSGIALALLARLAQVRDGALLSDSMFDWLFYGHLAKGYRNRIK